MRGIVISFLLLFSLSAQGQFVIDSYRFAPAGPLLVLDSFPGALSGYSLRKLDKDYSGNCVKIVRISDSDSLDIGFVGNFVDTAAISTFCASTTCRVRVWYDQSGNGNNAVNYTNGTTQPRIYASNAFFRIKNIPCVDFNSASNNNLVYTKGSEIAVQPVSIFGSFDINSILGTNILFDGQTLLRFMLNPLRSDSTLTLTNGGLELKKKADIDLLNPAVFYALFSGANSQASVNNNATSTGTIGTNSIGTRYVLGNGGDLGGRAISGAIGDIIIYNSNQSSNQSAIQTNINNFYSIY